MRTTGVIVEGWDRMDPFHLYGVKPEAMSAAGQAEADAAGVDRSAGLSYLDRFGDTWWHPDSPMFWLGAIGAVTFGLMAMSATIRVGSVKGRITAGEP